MRELNDNEPAVGGVAGIIMETWDESQPLLEVDIIDRAKIGVGKVKSEMDYLSNLKLQSPKILIACEDKYSYFELSEFTLLNRRTDFFTLSQSAQ